MEKENVFCAQNLSQIVKFVNLKVFVQNVQIYFCQVIVLVVLMIVFLIQVFILNYSWC